MDEAACCMGTNYDIQPDIVTTAKGLGGGLPIGATLLVKNGGCLYAWPQRLYLWG